MRNHRASRPSQPDPSTTFVEEQAWVARIKANDHAAFKALYDRYADGMFGFAYSSAGMTMSVLRQS